MTALVDRRIAANGLQHHLVEHPGGGRGTVVLLHGYLDLARSFEEVIAALGAAGYRVIAPDFRGHGDTDRIPPGAYYHAMDYVADLDALLDALALDRVHLVAHSMGGTVATRYAGARPARVASLALIEGVGPPAMPADVTPDRTALWLDGLKRARGRAPRPMGSLDEVVARMRVSHPSVPPDTLDPEPSLGFPFSRDLFGDGSVLLLDGRGHTAGSVVVAVKLQDGWLSLIHI